MPLVLPTRWALLRLVPLEGFSVLCDGCSDLENWVVVHLVFDLGLTYLYCRWHGFIHSFRPRGGRTLSNVRTSTSNVCIQTDCIPSASQYEPILYHRSIQTAKKIRSVGRCRIAALSIGRLLTGRSCLCSPTLFSPNEETQDARSILILIPASQRLRVARLVRPRLAVTVALTVGLASSPPRSPTG